MKICESDEQSKNRKRLHRVETRIEKYAKEGYEAGRVGRDTFRGIELHSQALRHRSETG